MKAIIVKEAGGIEKLQLEEIPMPECKPDQVLVEVKAAGINYIDIYIRNGLYPPRAYPYTPGKEGSGIIVAVGAEVQHLKPGDRVAFCAAETGTYAQYATVAANQVVVIPEAISFETAAAAMLQGLTAYLLSHITFPLNSSHLALIHAGAGGVGQLLIQLAKNAGAKVIATVSNEEKSAIAKSVGADEVVIYTQSSFLEFVQAYTHGRGVDVVYDAVGKTTFLDSMQALAIRGMLISYGQASGPVDPISLKQLAEKSLFLTRPVLFHYIQSKNELTDMANNLFTLILQQKLTLSVGQTYSLDEARTAQHDLENRKTVGKSLLLL